MAAGAWEYRLVEVYLKDSDSRGRGMAELNRLGRESWEAFSTQVMENADFPQEGPLLHVLLKRPLG